MLVRVMEFLMIIEVNCKRREPNARPDLIGYNMVCSLRFLRSSSSLHILRSLECEFLALSMRTTIIIINQK